jgi:hypothetical protein
VRARPFVFSCDHRVVQLLLPGGFLRLRIRF